MINWLKNISLVVLWLALAGTVGSQPFPTHDGRGPHPERLPGANIENLRLLKMLEVLDMDEEQSQKFIPVFHQFRSDLRDLRHERKMMLDSLASLIEQDNAEDQLLVIFEVLRENLDRIEVRSEKFFADCRQILTPHQLGRLLLFQERFEKEVLEKLREFRRRGPRAPVIEGDGK